MNEVGIDLSSARPQRLTPELAGQAQYLITMGCGDACPFVPGAKRTTGRLMIRKEGRWTTCDESGMKFGDA